MKIVSIFCLMVTFLGITPSFAKKVDGTNVYTVQDMDAKLKEGQFIEITRWSGKVGMIRTSNNPGVESKVEISDLGIVERYCDPKTVQSNEYGSIKCFVKSKFAQ